MCKTWRKYSWELIYSHIVVRRKSQLCTLVRLIEESRPKSSSEPHSIGWHITHIKLLATDHDTSRGPFTEDEKRPEDDSTANLIRRLLQSCPRLEVFLDAAPYAFEELPRSAFGPITRALSLDPDAPPNSSTIDVENSAELESSDPESHTRCSIRSLEWGYGCPSISDLISPEHARITRTVRVLRCSAVADPNYIFSTVQGTLRTAAYTPQLPPSLLHQLELSHSLSSRFRSLNDAPLLYLPNLVALDMYLSARSHQHWATLVCASSTTASGDSTPRMGLPALTHLTIRTPSSLGTIVGPEAVASLHTFLRAYGAQLKSLDLRVCPGDVDANARLPPPPPPFHHGIPLDPNANVDAAGGANVPPASSLLNIPLITARCPNLEDLILSSRWASPHSSSSSTVPPNANSNPAPFSIPYHANLKRIGLRDTMPHADGYSSGLASRACPCCKRVHTLSSASDAVLSSTSLASSSSSSSSSSDLGGSAQLPYRPRTQSPTSSGSSSHPFPSTLIESLLSGALVSNAMHDHRNSDGRAVMSQRHCTIDRHFRAMLTGIVPVCEKESQAHVTPFARGARREAVRDMLERADHPGVPHQAPAAAGVEAGQRQFGAEPRFPQLETIQLLDSQHTMFSPQPSSSFSSPFPSSSSFATTSHTTRGTKCGSTCWCVPHETRIEMNFWGSWAARCEERGVKLLDRYGARVPSIYAAAEPVVHKRSNSSPTLAITAAAEEAEIPERVDLDDELNLSIIRAAMSPIQGGERARKTLRPVVDAYAAVHALLAITFRSKGPRDMSMGEVVHRLVVWLAERGMMGTFCTSPRTENVENIPLTDPHVCLAGILTGARDCVHIVQYIIDVSCRTMKVTEVGH